jgi:serine/threonine-protein kinase
MGSSPSSSTVFIISFFTSVVTAIATIFVMQKIQQQPVPEEVIPKVVQTTATKDVLVPDLTGLSKTEAMLLIEQSKLKLVFGEPVNHDEIAKGKIASQVPAAGTRYEPGRTIIVKPSDGPAAIEVPKLTGLLLKKAKHQIKNAGFKLGEIKWAYNDDLGPFLVLKQTPGANEKAKPGTKIDLIVNEE